MLPSHGCIWGFFLHILGRRRCLPLPIRWDSGGKKKDNGEADTSVMSYMYKQAAGCVHALTFPPFSFHAELVYYWLSDHHCILLFKRHRGILKVQCLLCFNILSPSPWDEADGQLQVSNLSSLSQHVFLRVLTLIFLSVSSSCSRNFCFVSKVFKSEANLILIPVM